MQFPSLAKKLKINFGWVLLLEDFDYQINEQFDTREGEEMIPRSAT